MVPPLTLDNLKAWSKLIDEATTAANVVAADDTKDAIVALAKLQEATQENISQLSTRLERLEERLQRLGDTTDEFNGLLRDICHQTKIVISPGEKRKRRAVGSGSPEYVYEGVAAAAAVPAPLPLPPSSSAAAGVVPSAAPPTNHLAARLDGNGRKGVTFDKLGGHTIAEVKFHQRKGGFQLVTDLFPTVSAGDHTSLTQAAAAIEKFVTPAEQAYLADASSRDNADWQAKLQRIWDEAQFRLVKAVCALEVLYLKEKKAGTGGGKVNGIRGRLVKLKSLIPPREPEFTEDILKTNPCVIEGKPRALQSVAVNVAANRAAAPAAVDASPQGAAAAAASSSSSSSGGGGGRGAAGFLGGFWGSGKK